MRFFDSHAHYDDRRFSEEFPGGVDAALRYVYSQGVRRICDVGASLRSSTEALAMADFYAGQEGYPLL
ncbi:MAG: hypothetical protein E7631_00005, partial [Ruminococcaceae bacterium]|nr:hypothetical protein [Oscillospiraceae bacterium]